MARYKEYSYDQGKLIPIHFREQILPGTFEYTLNYLTDNESAKMKSPHGVIQGYDGVAVVDQKYQVVVHAEAFGQP